MSQQNKAALATAKVVPVFLAAIVIYASYVIVGPVSINYLINGSHPRVTAGIAIPIVWFVLLIPVIATWIRLLYVVFRHPGYISQGDSAQSNDLIDPKPPGLEEFYNKDVFVCDAKGLPIWCNHCHNWKPDRAHHNQDTGRCTMKMDHFCPWVGGVVGERAMKFFLQFLGYSFVLSAYGLVVLAYFVSETREDIQWIVAMALAGFFVFFTFGMLLNSLWMVFRNVTTIENIDSRRRTMLLAVLLPPELQNPQSLITPPTAARVSNSRSDDGESSERPLTSDLNDSSHHSYFSKGRSRRHPSRSKHWKGTVTYPLNLPSDRPPLPAPIPRTFAILETKPGSNPWDLGTAWHNFTSVFGYRLHHWLLPVRHSPCCDHSSMVSQYPLGPEFEQLLIDSGLAQYHEWNNNAINGIVHEEREERKPRRRLEEGWRNGERPDGWPTEKQVRRMRREASRKRIRQERRHEIL